MSRFEVSRDDERLMLTVATDEARMVNGCVWFGIAFVSVLILALLSLVLDAQSPNAGSMGGTAGTPEPLANHFSALWLGALVLTAVLATFYVYAVYDSRVVYAFDRINGVFTINRKVVTTLRRIEHVCVKRGKDPAERDLYDLAVVYADGHRITIDRSYAEGDVDVLAAEIADYIGVRVVFA
uniref:DUF304 domain-containing protein n=1 Tax=uncultured Armatimonadetes bacterium TaxID=157466 RepID=A0A6J4GZB5_9BACT|nr:hypothetical protein AVDCRST_MAG63-1540 [uncultured Armatimonadetes bacterium]